VKFLRDLFWEFVQNLPPIAVFLAALELWRQGWWMGAVICILAGSLVGALLIRWTESRIVEGKLESWWVTAANIGTMSVLMLLLVIYLSTSWSSWQTDLLFGAFAGVGVALAQDIASGEPISPRHWLALGAAAPVVLVGIRALVAALPILINILVITAVMTLIIGLIDYGFGRPQEGDTSPKDEQSLA